MKSARPQKFRHLLVVIGLVAVFFTIQTGGNTENPKLGAFVAQPVSDFSIYEVRIGMHRREVERLLGIGYPVSESVVGYGGEWTETNPFDVRRRKLTVDYNEKETVVMVTGQPLKFSGYVLKPKGSDYSFGDFGPSDGVAIAARKGDFDHAVMLRYPEAGVHVEYYDENRMWFTIFAPNRNDSASGTSSD